MKHFTILLLAALALASCKKEEAEAPQASEPVRQRTMHYQFTGGGYSWILFVDPAGQSHSIHLIGDTSFEQTMDYGARVRLLTDAPAGMVQVNFENGQLFKMDYQPPLSIDTTLTW